MTHVAALSREAPALGASLRVTVHFHPDRLFGGVLVLEQMLRDGVYRTQFETRTSNGGLTAHEGGDRFRWESRIFGGAYDFAPASERPRYGALDDRERPIGGAPRFGSAHFRLAAHTLARTTFCYPDSYAEPRDFGVAARCDLVALAERDRAKEKVDPLDDYVEAHVHGPVRIDRDIEALVLDPCYRDTRVEEVAHALPCAVEWHGGFRLSTDVLARHPTYRGAEFVELGMTLAEDGWLTPRMVGDASRSGRHDEQALKRVWHYLARFGAPEQA